MPTPNPQVDGYIRKNSNFQPEFQALRKIIHTFPLTEEIKWRVPCYTLNKKVVLFLGCYSEAAILSFAKGALLKDPKKILIQQTENMQAVRILRFQSLKEIRALEPTLKTYIQEAIDNETAGKKVKLKSTAEFKVPDEFKTKLAENPKLKAAFESLTPGRQRGYLLYFAGAKKSETRSARIDKYTPHILAGKGLDD
ncbi:MAG: YdeI/OmpD-associated family protein [Phycisphaerae bacterium]